MKNLARRVLKSRPVRLVARPLMAPFRFLVVRWSRQALAPRIEALEAQLARARTELDGLDRYVPVVLSSIAAQNAMSRAAVRTHEELVQLVRSTLERFDALRHETLAEVQRLAAAPPRPLVETKILNPEKVEAARSELRLDLGPRHDRRPDHVHVDSRPLDRVDIVADLRDLPFPAGTVIEIVSEHLVGTIAAADLADEVIPHWVSMLAPGGTLTAVVGDLDGMLRDYMAGGLPFDDLRAGIFGDTEDMARVASFSPQDLGEWFSGAGLVEVNVRPRSDGSHEAEVSGRRPAPARP